MGTGFTCQSIAHNLGNAWPSLRLTSTRFGKNMMHDVLGMMVLLFFDHCLKKTQNRSSSVSTDDTMLWSSIVGSRRSSAS